MVRIVQQPPASPTIASTNENEKKENVSKDFAHPLAVLLVDRLSLAGKAESTLDLLIDLELYRKENNELRTAFDCTKLCLRIVQVMKQSNSVKVQQRCCHIIICLTFEHFVNSIRLLNFDAAESVVHAMMTFPDSLEVQIYGCGSLRNLLWASPSGKNVFSTETVVAIIAAMERYPNNSNLQEKACGCLLNFMLCQDDNIKDSFIKQGGGILLANTHRRFAFKSKKVAELASHSLKLLFDSSEKP